MSGKARSPLCWIGGKYYMAKRIVPLIPSHTCYCEPFCGAAHVFFRKEPSPNEVLNDRNGELVNFWREIARDPAPFEQDLRFALYSRQVFDEYAASLRSKELTDRERAWRFLYVNRVCFGGRALRKRPTFGTRKSCAAPPALKLYQMGERLSLAHKRIARAQIECLDFRDCIVRYDTPDTFFYVDPPYENCEDDYGKGVFFRDDFAALASLLASIKGKFLLSINDSPFIRETFASFGQWSIAANYKRLTPQAGAKSIVEPLAVRELLIANYALPEAAYLTALSRREGL